MRNDLIDLIDRMTTDDGQVSSDKSISWLAHREAEKLDDLSILKELETYLTKKKKKDQRSAVYFIIGKIGKNRSSPECASRLIAYACVEQDKDVLANLLDRLAEIPKPLDVDISPLFPLLKDKRWLVRHSAIGALNGSVNPEAEDKLLEVLTGTTDSYDAIYCHATLNYIGTRKALPALEQGLKSRKRDVRISAQFAIDSIKAREAAQLGTSPDGAPRRR